MDEFEREQKAARDLFIDTLQTYMEELYGHAETEYPFVDNNLGLSKRTAEVLHAAMQEALNEIWKCDICGEPAVSYTLGPNGKVSYCWICFGMVAQESLGNK